MDAKNEATSRFLRNVIDAVADPILVKDRQHRWIEFNRAFCELMLMSREEMLGRSDYDFVSPQEADVYRSKDDAVFASGRDNVNEETFTDRSGATHVISTKKSVFTGPEGGPMLVAVMHDITELRAAERRNLEMTQHLATSAKFAALGEMAGGIAHEINTPLAIIQGLADELLALAEDEELTLPKVSEITQNIGETVARVGRIISGLRAFARDGRKERPEVVPLRQLVSESLTLCEQNLRLLGIRLDVTGDAGEVTVSCRPTQIVQILLNLLNNARDAVSGTEVPAIEVHASADERHAELRVIDSGPGISPGLRERIMEPFFTTKPVGTGTGIGLSLARSLAQDNGGTLTLDDEHPRTCFVLRLVRAPAKEGA
ncbi:MAG: PAS domain-containing protein [Myxococcales bacterium]|nr:PAS domain-containing protein [Myxococcales bacterium]